MPTPYGEFEVTTIDLYPMQNYQLEKVRYLQSEKLNQYWDYLKAHWYYRTHSRKFDTHATLSCDSIVPRRLQIMVISMKGSTDLTVSLGSLNTSGMARN